MEDLFRAINRKRSSLIVVKRADPLELITISLEFYSFRNKIGQVNLRFDGLDGGTIAKISAKFICDNLNPFALVHPGKS